MTMKSGVIVPVYFDRQNSRLLQIACHLHYSLRVGLLIKELRARVDAPLRVVIGERIDPAEPAAHRGNSRSLMAFLRHRTYSLSPRPFESIEFGFEYEERWKT